MAGARERDDDAVDALLRRRSRRGRRGRRSPAAGGPSWPLCRGSPSSRKPTRSMRYSGWPAILAATVWPTSPAPMISTRSWNDGRDQTVDPADPAGRAARARTARAQKAISGATGASAPSASTRAMSSSQLADVSAVRPVSPSPRLKPPMLRAGLAVQAEGPERREPVRRQQDEGARAPTCGSLSNAPLSLLEQRQVVERSRRPRPRAATTIERARRCPRTASRRRAARDGRRVLAPALASAPQRWTRARPLLFECPIWPCLLYRQHL